MSLELFILIIKFRWKAFVSVFLTIVVGALLVTLALPKQYKADVQILVDPKAADIQTNNNNVGQSNSSYLSTQADILVSDKVVNKVIAKLHLTESDFWKQKWQASGKKDRSIEYFISQEILKKISVKPSRESSVIAIEFSSKDPDMAAAVVNAFAESYIDTNLELKVDPAKKYVALYTEKTSKLRVELETAQQKLSAFQKSNGIVLTDDKIDIENARLADLSNQLANAQGQKLDANSRLLQAQGNNSSQDVLLNPLIQSLRTDIIRQETKIKEIAEQYGVNHPQYQNAVSQLAELKSKLQSESKQVANSYGSATQVGALRENELKQAIEKQKQRMLDLRKIKDQYNVLQRDVDSAQKAYEIASQKLSQNAIDTQTQQTNAVLISQAVPPAEHSNPKLSVNLLFATILGFIAATILCLLLEFKNKVIRVETDILAKHSAPLLVSIKQHKDTSSSSSGNQNKTTNENEPSFTKFLLERNRTTPKENESTELTKNSKPGSIGAILVQDGKISQADAERIYEAQQINGLSFGEAAIKLGLANPADIDLALAEQYNYPVIAKTDNFLSESLITAYKPDHPLTEQIRALRSQLILRWLKPHPTHKTVSIVGPGHAEGRSFIAANLAVVFAQLGERTLLIDADLRNPSQHKFFKLDNKKGLSSVLSARSGSECVKQIAALSYLSVLPSGPIPPNPQELISRTLFSKLLEEARKVFDVIIIDTPHAETASDAQIIASITGASVVVVKRNQTELKSYSDLLDSLDIAGTHIIGTVVNDTDNRKNTFEY